MLTGTTILILLALAADGDGHTMTIRMKPAVLLEGGRVEVECRVSDVRTGSLFIVWFRRGPNAKEVELATSGHVNEVFRKTGRYLASHKNHDNSTVSYSLTILDAKTWDSGEIGCRIPNSFEIFKELSVITPVSNVLLTSRDDENAYLYANGDVATFDEGVVVDTTCKVNASYPRPHLTISSGEEDISDLFDVSHRLVSGQSSRWMTTFYYESVARSRPAELTMRYSMNGKNLTCSAWHLPDILPPVRVSILVRLDKYLPKFDCPKKTQAKLYQKGFKIVCFVHANPGVESALVRWKKFSLFPHVLLPNSTTGNYRLRVVFGANRTEMVLSIERMFPQTFRAYRLEASNSMGATTQEVVVMETDRHSANAGHGLVVGSPSSSSSSLFFLILLPVFMSVTRS